MINPARLRSDLSRLGRENDMLEATVASLSEEELAAPSLCAGWTRAHVVAHLAADADALSRMVEVAVTGVERPLYASAEARESEIAELAALDRAALVERLRESSARFAREAE